MTQYKLGFLDQIPPGEGRAFLVDGRRIAVFHSRDGCAYATQAECPHRQGPLADGLVGGATVICPLHERTFDLTTGRGLNCEGQLQTFALLREADGSLSVELDSEAAPLINGGL